MGIPLNHPKKKKQRSLLQPMASARSQKPDTVVTHRMSKPFVLFSEIGWKIPHLPLPCKMLRLALSFLDLRRAENGRAGHGNTTHVRTE